MPPNPRESTGGVSLLGFASLPATSTTARSFTTRIFLLALYVICGGTGSTLLMGALWFAGRAAKGFLFS